MQLSEHCIPSQLTSALLEVDPTECAISESSRAELCLLEQEKVRTFVWYTAGCCTEQHGASGFTGPSYLLAS